MNIQNISIDLSDELYHNQRRICEDNLIKISAMQFAFFRLRRLDFILGERNE